ncbi:MAG: hypothetical protein K2X66_14100, partial [Cyanobacteria bacterium]|nr:hypothetical protein [Cyanobacteriota bacterium]
MNTISIPPSKQWNIHFSATAKTAATKSDFGGKLDYQVKDLASGVRQLKYLLDIELRTQKNYRLLGCEKIKNGQREGVITDEYLALWDVSQKLGEKQSVSQQERDAFNIAIFFLMNEEAHETGDNRNLIFKKISTNQQVQLNLPADNNEDSAGKRSRVVLTSILCPGSFVIPDRPITLENFDTKLPKRTQLQNLEKKAKDRLAIGIARKEIQEAEIQAHIDKINLDNERKRQEALKLAEKQRLETIRVAEEFRKKSGLESVAERYKQRHTLAQTFQYPVLKERKKALENIQQILSTGKLTPAETKPLQEVVNKITQILEVPVLEYQIKDVAPAQDLLHQKIIPIVKAQKENKSFGYETNYAGKPEVDRPLSDETVALWEVVTELLTKSKKTDVEEDAIEVGLLMLNHLANHNGIRYKTNYISGKQEEEYLFKHTEGYRVSLSWRQDLIKQLISKDSVTIEQVIEETKNLNFEYPKEKDWKSIINNMRKTLEY